MMGSTEASEIESQVRILAIIVVYKMNPLLTPSFIALQAAKEAIPQGRLALRTLLYDNSSGSNDPGPMPDGVEYLAASENTGLSNAYNYAVRLAARTGYDWLLTLDQDTTLPPEFFVRVTEIASRIKNDTSIAAIVPLITDGGKSISPNWFWGNSWPRWYHRGKVGLGERTTYAFNSASTLRVASILEVGGYNPWFWLDYSDGYIFRQFQHHEKRVFILGDVEVAHEFSLMELESRVSLSRYWNMRLAESAFWDLELGVLAGMERTLGLAILAFRHLFLHESQEHRAVTYEFLKRRLFWTRKRRLDAWERETLMRFPSLSEARMPPYI
jgi:glycosyltransferase involved in cell wall biosynthesis